jgi:hypothetical protein
MKDILKCLTNVAVVSQKGKQKNNHIITNNKKISPNHKREKQTIDVDLGRDNGAQTCSYIKNTTYNP